MQHHIILTVPKNEKCHKCIYYHRQTMSVVSNDENKIVLPRPVNDFHCGLTQLQTNHLDINCLIKTYGTNEAILSAGLYSLQLQLTSCSYVCKGTTKE